MWIRSVAKAVAPANLTRLVRWRRSIWRDLRLRLLSDLGHFPSHAVRNVFYRRSGLTLPRSSSIHWHFGCYAPENIVIGETTVIGGDCFIDGRSGVTIGRSVNIGGFVSVYTRQHDIDDPGFAECGGPVVIGDYAYLGSHTVVLPGVTVGEGSVTAAGSVVTNNVPPYTMVGGVPAVHIRNRSRDLSYELRYKKRFV